MAHFVAKELKMRPNDILDEWGCAELLVAYGHYANEIADKNYREYQSYPPEVRAKYHKPPHRYFVEFIDG